MLIGYQSDNKESHHPGDIFNIFGLGCLSFLLELKLQGFVTAQDVRDESLHFHTVWYLLSLSQYHTKVFDAVIFSFIKLIEILFTFTFLDGTF